MKMGFLSNLNIPIAFSILKGYVKKQNYQLNFMRALILLNILIFFKCKVLVYFCLCVELKI